MNDLQKLTTLLQRLEGQLAQCMKCGMCQAVCPLYAHTGREADVARGKLALIHNLANELLQDPLEVKKRLDRCLLCGSCAANCPSGVKVLEIFLLARTVISGYLGLSPLKKVIFRGMLVNPKLLDHVLSIGAKTQKIFSKQANPFFSTSCARINLPGLQKRHFPPLASTPWHKTTKTINTSRKANPETNRQTNHIRKLSQPGQKPSCQTTGQQKPGLKIAYFPGCLVDKIFPHLGKASLRIFNHHKLGIFIPEEQICCGIPALAAGDLSAFKVLVKKNLELFVQKDFDFLITPCATCTATIKKFWPLFADKFSPADQKAIFFLADKTRDFSEFIVNELCPPSPANLPQDQVMLTYHDPCHLKKSLNIFREPRQLLALNPNYKLVEMDKADACCGLGGSFNLQHYDLSAQIGKEKVKNISKAKASVVATSCPACMLQLTDQLSQQNIKTNVRHVLEIYAQTLK